MYNVFTVIQSFGIVNPQVIWLDGHAQASMDDSWYRLFVNRPLHLQRVAAPQFDHAILVPTISAMGDEGLHRYEWGKKEGCHDNNSGLIQFRTFVLKS
jgi:hypothetical protein